jgi:hypothetical protein
LVSFLLGIKPGCASNSPQHPFACAQLPLQQDDSLVRVSHQILPAFVLQISSSTQLACIGLPRTEKQMHAWHNLPAAQGHNKPLEQNCKETQVVSTDDHSGALMQNPAQQKGSIWPGTFMSQ